MSKAKDKRRSQAIIEWYRDNARDLPWRKTQDPYKIWISEIMLQQTTVAQGHDYYLRFLKAFPTIKALAKASQDEVMKMWEGLGYYSRARNLHYTAKDIVNNYAGIFPSTYDTIIKLKGIGPYTAAAISSFVYGLPKVVVDGNVLRVISRLYGIDTSIDEPSTQKTIKALAQSLLNFQDPAEFNQSIMEFGALCCTYKKPSCVFCPVKKECVAYKDNLVELLPVKTKKIKKRKRFFHYLIILDASSKVCIQQRQEKDIWQGLYQFPLLEMKALPKGSEAWPMAIPKGLFIASKTPALTHNTSILYKQTLTHQFIHARFSILKVNSRYKKTLPEGYTAVLPAALSQYAFPKIITSYLSEERL